MTQLRATITEFEDVKLGTLTYINKVGAIEMGELIICLPKYPINDPVNPIIKEQRIDAVNSQFCMIIEELSECGCKVNAKDFCAYKLGGIW